jgi:GxxExxY protein
MSAGMEQDDPLTKQVIGCAIEGHRTLEPGLLESAYEARLVHELTVGGLHAVAQVPLAVHYKGVQVDVGYRLDLVVAGRIAVEVKAVEKILPVHEAQLLTYLRLLGYKLGLLLNFNSKYLKDGIIRRVM